MLAISACTESQNSDIPDCSYHTYDAFMNISLRSDVFCICVSNARGSVSIARLPGKVREFDGD